MRKVSQANNFAYIDGNNLYRGVNNSGWKIDFFRFRKRKIKKAPIKDWP
jgi:hypothetical protein